MSSQGIETSLSPNDFQELKGVIKEFLSKYRYLYEFRVQKLVFYAEVYTIDNYERRLTDASWKPYIYGSFSEDVRVAVRELDVPTQTVYRNGDETIKYLNKGLSGQHLENEAKRAILDRVHQRTRNQSTKDLAQFSKNHWLFEHTDYESVMSFEKYLDHIQDIDEGDRGLFDPDHPEIRNDRLVQVNNEASSTQE